jgi:asparagine synthase (glutamine-hydrolysing)
VKTAFAVVDKRGENAAPKVISVLRKMSPSGMAQFVLATPSTLITAENSEDLRAEKIDSPIALGAASLVSGQNERQMLKLENAMLSFEGRIYSPVPKGAAIDFVAWKMQANYANALKAFLKGVEGDFSILITQTDKILAARDPVGVQPLYYGENERIAVLASNRKALWELGIEEPNSFPPGHLAFVTKEGFKFEPTQTLTFTKPKPIGMQQAAQELHKLLEHSVQMRVFGQKDVAVAFSGGLDSSVVACLAKKCAVNVHLIHVSLEGQSETQEARKAAEELDLPLQVHLFTEADVEKAVSKVVELVEESDPIKASVGVPFYWNAQKAASEGFRVLLAGQGADELFGGYQRYVNEYILVGDEEVRKTMFNDVAVIHESNIERDEKICGFHDVELRLPFASFQIADFAMSLPTELKIEKEVDSLRKLVLRKIAESIGLSRGIADKPKKAVQYSTGINNALKKLAKKHNLTLAEYVNQIFLEVKNNSERL